MNQFTEEEVIEMVQRAKRNAFIDALTIIESWSMPKWQDFQSRRYMLQREGMTWSDATMKAFVEVTS